MFVFLQFLKSNTLVYASQDILCLCLYESELSQQRICCSGAYNLVYVEDCLPKLSS